MQEGGGGRARAGRAAAAPGARGLRSSPERGDTGSLR